MEFCYINETVYPLETYEEIAIASQALREAGIASTRIYAGDPDRDSVESTTKLFVPAIRWEQCQPTGLSGTGEPY